MVETPSRATLCVTFDNMGAALQVGRKERASPDENDPSLRIGYPAVLAMLDDVGVKGTFFVEGWNALHHPQTVRDIVDQGHEIGVHGWVHEAFVELDLIDAERVTVDALAAYRNLGIRPTGFRAPGGRLSHDQAALIARLGFDYDSSLAPDEGRSDRISVLPSGLVNIPWSYPQIDNYHFAPERPDRAGGPLTPDAFCRLWCDMIDQAAESGSLLTFIIHAAVTGIEQARVEALGRVLQYALHHPLIDVRTAGEIAAMVRQDQS